MHNTTRNRAKPLAHERRRAATQRRAAFIGLMLVLMVGAPAVADIYRWKDDRGVTHFSNEPPPPGVVPLEKIEEAPYDAAADRQRIEEERQLRLERQRLELEERKAGLAAREREAQQRMDDAERRLEEARQIEQEPPEDDCDEDYFLRFGSCGSPAFRYRNYPARPGSPNLYRGYYRENNSLYYRDLRRPGHPPGPGLQPPPRPGSKPAPRPDGPPSGVKGKKAAPAPEDPALKGALPPAAPK